MLARNRYFLLLSAQKNKTMAQDKVKSEHINKTQKQNTNSTSNFTMKEKLAKHCSPTNTQIIAFFMHSYIVRLKLHNCHKCFL